MGNTVSNRMSINIKPEIFRFFAYAGMCLILALAIIVTHVFNPDFIHDNPVANTFGKNNICIYFDSPPANFMMAPLFIIFVMSPMSGYFIFTFLEHKHLLHIKNLSKRNFILRSISLIFCFLCFCMFSSVFAVSPFESWNYHVVGYICIIIGLLVLGLANSSYYFTTKDISKNTRIYFVLYYIAFSIISLCNLIALYVLYNIGYKGFFAEHSNLIGRIWLVLTLIMPMIHSLYFTKKNRGLSLVFG